MMYKNDFNIPSQNLPLHYSSLSAFRLKVENNIYKLFIAYPVS